MMRLHFGSNTLDLEARELRRGEEVVALEPRTFEVLAHLVRHRDRVVPKEELLDEIWGDRFVGESALTTQITHLRNAVGDDGRTQRVIKTAHRVGYRFVAGVTEEDGPPRATATTVPAARWGRLERLLGRDSDLAQVEERLTDHALVTITGPGGVGKTAVARAVVERLGPRSPDGAWVCALADTRDPQVLGNVVLDAIGQGQHSDADPLESLVRVLEGRRALLVLDNCEHVQQDAAALASELLARCPELRILATSRVPLGLDGESVHPLGPLDPDAAVACFLAAANDAGASFDQASPEISDLCRRLDHLPLAIELAAARARVLSPTEMLGLLSDRFGLLRDDARDVGRHASLRTTIELSWNGLAPPDQDLLAQLGVFVGSFTLDDVRGVALAGADPLDVVDAMGRLVRHSLVTTVVSAGGITRFRLLESVRDFAVEQLDRPDVSRRSHAEHFTALAESLDAELQTDRIDDAVEAMRAAWPNLRAAAAHATSTPDPDLLRRLIRAVGPFADVFQVFEVLDWCARADLIEPGADRAISADALAIEARMRAHRGELGLAQELAETAHGWCETHATALSLVWSAYYRGDLDVVVDLAERLGELSRSDRGFDRGFADGFAAVVATVRQEPQITSTTLTPDHAERGLLGVQDCMVEGLRLCAADPERAAGLLEAVVSSSIEHDYRLHLGAAASTLTQITLPAMPPADAVRSLRRTLERYLDRSMWTLISADTVMAARLLADHGEVETAARLLGARLASGYAVGLSELLRSELQEDLRGRLGDRFEPLAAEGARWRPPDAGRRAIEALDRILEGGA